MLVVMDLAPAPSLVDQVPESLDPRADRGVRSAARMGPGTRRRLFMALKERQI